MVYSRFPVLRQTVPNMSSVDWKSPVTDGGQWSTADNCNYVEFLANRTNGRAIGAVLHLSSVICLSVCLWRYVLWLNGAS